MLLFFLQQHPVPQHPVNEVDRGAVQDHELDPASDRAFEVGFVSAAHTEADIQDTIEAASAAFKTLQ